MFSPGDYILLAGWRLCAIASGKGPTYPGWSTREGAIDDPAIADTLTGCGLLHAYSGTCALDVDDIAKATAWCAERGIMLKELLHAPDAVHILSGRPGRDKLLYRLDTPLRSVKPDGSGLEFRCAAANGNSVQDALPNTVHPLTKRPYEWRGDWMSLPPLPAAVLHAWRELIALPAARPEEPAAPRSDDMAYLTSLVQGRDPSASYDDWLRIGMALHNATGGAAIGLKVWNDWSKAGKTYKGLDDLKAHWVSFRADHPNPVTAAGLESSRPAQPDEFQDETPVAADTPATDDPLEMLRRRMVFVESLQHFYDIETGRVIAGPESMYSEFAHLFKSKGRSRVDVWKKVSENKNKLTAEGIGFHPGEGPMYYDNGALYVNKYTGSLPEPLAPTAKELETIRWWFARIVDERFRNYLLDFYACVVQRPGTKIRSAPLIWSKTQGNGKSLTLDGISCALVGAGYSHSVNTAALEKEFNAFLLDHWHIGISELKAGNRRDAAALMTNIKPWFTDQTVSVRALYTDHQAVPNRFFLTITSNESGAVLIDENDRRVAVHKLRAGALNDADAARAVQLIKGPRAGGVFRAYFEARDISRFNPDAPAPKTDDRQEMIEAVRSDEEVNIQELFDSRRGVFQRDAATSKTIQDEIKALCGYHVTHNKVNELMEKIGAVKRRTPSNRVYIWRNAAMWLAAPPAELDLYVDGADVTVHSNEMPDSGEE